MDIILIRIQTNALWKNLRQVGKTDINSIFNDINELLLIL